VVTAVETQAGQGKGRTDEDAICLDHLLTGRNVAGHVDVNETVKSAIELQLYRAEGHRGVRQRRLAQGVIPQGAALYIDGIRKVQLNEVEFAFDDRTIAILRLFLPNRQPVGSLLQLNEQLFLVGQYHGFLLGCRERIVHHGSGDVLAGTAVAETWTGACLLLHVDVVKGCWIRFGLDAIETVFSNDRWLPWCFRFCCPHNLKFNCNSVTNPGRR
jgi:hypothetical protein